LLRRLVTAFSVLTLSASFFFVAGMVPARAASSYLCQGYSACAAKGYSHAGYASANRNHYWRMSPGHNCTNYVAYRMIKNGATKTRPWSSTGNAYNWGAANPSKRDLTPVVGAVAWWKARVKGAGSLGHVAYVERVVSADEIVISEDNWGGNFSWRRVKRSSGWPSGFVHFADAGVGSPRGVVNSVKSTASGKLSVRGWAFDPNKKSAAVRIRVYVGGRPGVGQKISFKSATLSRPDVAKAYSGVGAKHGFSQTVSVKQNGTVAVYVYALDVEKTAGGSALLGRSTVAIRR
jgi:surface antigen